MPRPAVAPLTDPPRPIFVFNYDRNRCIPASFRGSAAMEATTTARKTGRAERREDVELDARWPGQCQMIRAAQIAFGGSVLDCALLETARAGRGCTFWWPPKCRRS
jgi:hypothetical protein